MQVYKTDSNSSFRAQLKLYAKKDLIKPYEAVILKKLASKIGNDVDSINISIGNLSGKFDYDDKKLIHTGSKYNISIQSIINGKEYNENINEIVNIRGHCRPFKTLKLFLQSL